MADKKCEIFTLHQGDNNRTNQMGLVGEVSRRIDQGNVDRLIIILVEDNTSEPDVFVDGGSVFEISGILGKAWLKWTAATEFINL